MSLLTTPSQIAQRQLDYFKNKNILIAGEAEDLFCLELSEIASSVTIFTTHYGYHQEFSQHQQVESVFDTQYSLEKPIDLLLFYWPKAKAESEYLLAMLLSHLNVGTEVCFIGENRSGIKSAEKMFSAYGEVKKYDSARRCSFYFGEYSEQAPKFDLAKWIKTYTLTLGEQSLTVKSLPGVFSHGEFDQGSKLLLDTLPSLKGKVLDFGCGAGVIGSMLKIKNPNIKIQMCDVSALAIASTKMTLAENGLEGDVYPSNIYSDVQGKYDFIISNPPFHSGLDTQYSVTESLLSQAPNYLSGRGRLFIVANNFLKYQPIIEKAFGECITIDKNTKFSIYSNF